MEEEKKKTEYDVTDTFLDEGVEGLDDSFADITDEVKEIGLKAKKAIEDSFSDLMAKINSIDLSKEKVDGYLDGWKENYRQIVSKADEAVKGFMNDARNSEYWNSVKSIYNDISNAVVTSVTDAYNKAREVSVIRKAMDTVTNTCHDAYSAVNDKYQEFIHNETVKRIVVGAVDYVKDLYDDAAKVFFDKKEKDE